MMSPVKSSVYSRLSGALGAGMVFAEGVEGGAAT
jgi:hypothetical protein